MVDHVELDEFLVRMIDTYWELLNGTAVYHRRPERGWMEC